MCPVQKFRLHQFKIRLVNLEKDLCLAGPTSDTPPHRALLSSACVQHSSTKNAAGRLHRSFILSINSAVFHLTLTEIAEDVGYIPVVLHVLPENPCSPKLPAFKVGCRLGCIQSAAEQNKTHVML